MADEKVLRIEFHGDDGGDSPSHGSDPRDTQSANESYQQAQAHNERQEQDRVRRNRQVEEESRAKFDADLEDRIKAGDDEPLPTGPSAGRHQQPTYGTPVDAEEVEEEHPYFSTSRELTIYNPRTAHAGSLHPPETEYGEGPTATGGMGGGPPEPPSEPGWGAAELPESFNGIGMGGAAEGAAAPNIGEIGEALTAIAGPAALVAGGLASLAISIVTTADALTHLYDAGTAQFERVNGVIASARAQETVELIQQRIETANEIAGSTTSVIQDEIEWKKAIIKLEGHGTVIIGHIAKAILPIGTKILHSVDWLVSWFTGLPPESDNKPNAFEQEVIDFFKSLPLAGGMNQPHSNRPTRTTHHKHSRKNQP